MPRSATRSRNVAEWGFLGALLTALALALVGCAGPTVTDDGYRAKTAGTLQDISSALSTAKLTMQRS